MRVLWIDDCRQPPQFSYGDYIHWSKDYDDAINELHTKRYDLICLDHDLGQERSGYDIAKWLIENYRPCEFFIQSMNPVGRINISQFLTHYGFTEKFFI